MRVILLAGCLWGGQEFLRGQAAPVYQDFGAPLEQRVQDLFQRLTPEEKLHLLTGTGFTTQPIPRLGVPAMGMVDAGQGVRGGAKSTQGAATAFPSGVTMASSWNVDLVGRIGNAIGAEARNKGTGAQVLLGPAVNIQRSPLGGRNGEYFSEDPFLAGRLAAGYIRGVQSNGVSACIKHYACNNEEVDRDFVDVKVSERALREIYLPAFEAGVKEGGVWALMSSYNQVNGTHASANAYLLTKVLKQGWQFDGLVMSDWGGVHEVAVAQAGNDLEMPGGKFATVAKLQAALKDGRLTQAAVDDSVRRILRTVIRVGLLDPRTPPDAAVVNAPEHQKLAFTAAAEGIVLLKNERHLLPLDRREIHTIAVLGRPAKHLEIGALGSPEVTPFYQVQVLDGIQKQAGAGVTVDYVAGTYAAPLPASAVTVPGSAEHGFKAEYFTGGKLGTNLLFERVDDAIQFDTDQQPWAGVPKKHFSVRWTADLKAPVSGDYVVAFTSDDRFQVRVDGTNVIESSGGDRALGNPPLRTASVHLNAETPRRLEVDYFLKTGRAVARLAWLQPGERAYADAVAAAARAEVAIVCVSTDGTEEEGWDRHFMEPPYQQDQLIQNVAAVNTNTVVILNNGTPIALKNWLPEVPALVEGWLPGQEGGAALAAVLFGEVNPSGKLPTTLAVERQDYPDFGNFPGHGDFDKNQSVVNYAEDIYVGYRWFDKHGVAPCFPFGYGLSYTTFEYQNLRLPRVPVKAGESVAVSVDITNTGKRAGGEIAELYVQDTRPRVDKPVRELKGFAKVFLAPGETQTVTFTLTPRSFAYFDVSGKQWRADAGDYTVEIGASSRDIRQSAPLKLAETWTEPVSGAGR